MHVTLRVRHDVGNLRVKARFRALKAAFRAGSDRFGFRLVHFSVQSNHLHLLVEAKDKDALGRGLRGLSIRIARGINRAVKRKGRVFADRYHARALRTPREVRNCLIYVLNNRAKHVQAGLREGRVELDPCCSGAWFDGWKGGAAIEWPDPGERPPVVGPKTWLLRVGWRKHGPVSLADVPKGPPVSPGLR